MKKIKIFCFPHLGGSASIYYQWKTMIHKNIEIIPIELAGRGERNKEPFCKNFKELLLDISIQITNNHLEKYAFFGHFKFRNNFNLQYFAQSKLNLRIMLYI